MDKSKWKYKKLGEVATFVNGYAFKPSDWKGQGLPIIRIQNLTNSDAPYNYYDGNEIDSKYFVDNGDLLVSWSATLGAFLWNKGKAVLNQHIFKTVFDKTDINKHFLKYAIISTLNVMATKAHGITMRHITKKEFDNIAIPFPSISIQQRIVSELDQLTELISLKQQQLKEYDSLAQSLFYKVIHDSKLSGNTETRELGDISEYSNERCTASQLTTDNYVGVENLLKDCGGKTVASTLGKVSSATAYKTGDVLIGNIRPYLKKIWLANRNGGASGDVLVIRIQNEFKNKIHPTFIYCSLARDEFFEYDYSHSKGVKMPRGDKKVILKYPISIPPYNAQRKLADYINMIDKQKSIVKQSIAETQTLLDSRMQEYFDNV